MEMFVVKLVNHGLGIGIILVEDVLAFAVPPKPILDDVVDRQMQVAVLFRNAENLFL